MNAPHITNQDDHHKPAPATIPWAQLAYSEGHRKGVPSTKQPIVYSKTTLETIATRITTALAWGELRNKTLRETVTGSSDAISKACHMMEADGRITSRKHNGSTYWKLT